MVLPALLFSSCNKLDLGNVHGVHAEGEMLLPLASATYTIMDMMERFQIDDLIDCDASGHMHYDYYYENKEAIRGSELLTFKDMTIEEHFSFKNPVSRSLPTPFDTTITFQHTVTLQSEHIHVTSALMKSGSIDFRFESDFVQVKDVVIRCAEIKDADGQVMEWTAESGANTIELGGLRYESNTSNTMDFGYEVHVALRGENVPEIGFNVCLNATDLALKEMFGSMEPYLARNRIDTAFNLFPDNVLGNLEIKNVRISMAVRNSFQMPSRIVVDTAVVSGPGIASFPVFNVMPQIVNIPFTPDYEEVFHQTVDGLVCAHDGHAFATSEFVLNPDGMSEQVSVSDTSAVGVRVDAVIPLSFRLDDVRYIDTVNMRLSAIESPEWIKKLTLELDINSTIPLNLTGDFYMYDVDEECVTDTLVNGSTLIPGAFDGQATHAAVSVEITDERLERVMRSERIILNFGLDTDSNEVTLDVNQALQFFVKAKVEYDGIVEFEND